MHVLVVWLGPEFFVAGGEERKMNEPSNVIGQEFETEFDEKGREQYHLQTTVSLDDAINQAKYDNEMGGRIGKGSDEVLIKAEIPMEMWALDPMLKKAAFFKAQGDIAHYTHYFDMFLRLNPQFKVEYRPKFFTTR